MHYNSRSISLFLKAKFTLGQGLALAKSVFSVRAGEWWGIVCLLGQLGKAVVFKLRFRVESPGKLLRIPMPGSHLIPQEIRLSRGWELTSVFLKIPK